MQPFLLGGIYKFHRPIAGSSAVFHQFRSIVTSAAESVCQRKEARITRVVPSVWARDGTLSGCSIPWISSSSAWRPSSVVCAVRVSGACETRDRNIVEPRERDVLRYAHARLSQGEQAADGHHVVPAEHASGRAAAVAAIWTGE